MNLSSLSIQRPVLALVFTIVILLFGAIGFSYRVFGNTPAWIPPL
jgi:multidrug efflux pump subunit AcrB